MTKKISEIEGIGPAFSAKLEKAGITTVEGLLEKGGTKAGRKAISSESGLDDGKILDFVNMADLFRIKGIGSQFAELLKASGVDTVKELRNRNPASLHTKWKFILKRSLPGLFLVKLSWQILLNKPKSWLLR